jgi:hypothetical protein
MGVRRNADINRQFLLEAGSALVLATATAQRLIENLLSRSVLVTEALYAEYEGENAKILRSQSQVPTTMAGES